MTKYISLKVIQKKFHDFKKTAECVLIKSKRNIKTKIYIRRAKKALKNIKFLYESRESVLNY